MSELFIDGKTLLNAENLNSLIIVKKQNFNDAEKQQARTNIGAASQKDVTDALTRITTLETRVNDLYAKLSRTVTFNLNGGTGNFPIMKVIKDSAAVEPPSRPTKSGYTFKYWALSTNQAQGYNWAAPVTGNIMLIAIWSENPKEFCTVSFAYDGSIIGDIQPITVKYGSILNKGMIAILTIYGELMYLALSTDLTREYNWNEPVTSDIILVPVWYKGIIPAAPIIP